MGLASRPPLAVMLCVVLAYASPGVPAARAQTRAECEDGIGFIREALARSTDDKQRAALAEALRDAERELREGEYDECLEAVENARAATGGAPGAAAARPREADERLSADGGLPVTVEDAFVPKPGEIEAKVTFAYDRVRRKVSGEADEGTLRRTGRNRYTPGTELEVGLVPGLAARLGADYRFGDADETKSGDAELGAKWNVLPGRGWLPALTLDAGVSLPYGYQNRTVESALALLGSLPLGDGADAPYLHANLIWAHAFDPEAEARTNRYAGIIGLALPVASSTGLILDVVREQESERGHVSNLFELGVRQVLPGDFVLAAGAGIGFGNSDTDFRLLVGVQKGF